MLLSDKSIEKNIANGTIEVEPQPSLKQIQPASLDVCLGSELVAVDSGKEVVGENKTLNPNRRYLGHTLEKISLPNDIAAQITGRSTVGRHGVIVHKTAGWVDPGFEGELVLEMMNLGTSPQTFSIGERVAQLSFFKLDQPSSGYDGSYQGQEGATGAR